MKHPCQRMPQSLLHWLCRITSLRIYWRVLRPDKPSLPLRDVIIHGRPKPSTQQPIHPQKEGITHAIK